DYRENVVGGYSDITFTHSDIICSLRCLRIFVAVRVRRRPRLLGLRFKFQVSGLYVGSVSKTTPKVVRAYKSNRELPKCQSPVSNLLE
ncbi:MAG: hypothetical protein ACI4TV_07575, partial [Paludibacteraceae bacterium]